MKMTEDDRSLLFSHRELDLLSCGLLLMAADEVTRGDMMSSRAQDIIALDERVSRMAERQPDERELKLLKSWRRLSPEARDVAFLVISRWVDNRPRR